MEEAEQDALRRRREKGEYKKEKRKEVKGNKKWNSREGRDEEGNK